MSRTIDTLINEMSDTYIALVDGNGNIHLKYKNALSGRIIKEVMRELDEEE